MSSKETSIDTTIYRDIGELNGQVGMLRERVISIESMMAQSDAKLLERLEDMQNSMNAAIAELETKGEAQRVSLKFMAVMAASGFAGGGTFSGLIMNLLG